jgi:hypothetical protein
MNELDNQYATLSEAVDDLRRKGYTDELTLTEEGLFHVKEAVDPMRFSIDSYHRFEGPSDPGDLSIVYAVSSQGLHLKGLLVGGYGPEAQGFIQKMVDPLDIDHPKGYERPARPDVPGGNVKL